MGSNSAGCLHGFCAVANVGFAQLNLRSWISALGTLPEVTKVRIPAAKNMFALPGDQPKVGLPYLCTLDITPRDDKEALPGRD